MGLFIEASGSYYGWSLIRFSWVSLTAARPDIVTIEIS